MTIASSKGLDGAAHSGAAGIAPAPATFGRSGTLEVRLARSQAEIEASQRLRFRVFYEEMSAEPTPAMARAERDFDPFDEFCDHLLVIDHALHEGGEDGTVVGTYRLLRQDVAERHGGFYTQNEFDVASLIARRPAGTRFLELGRSCTHANYRSKPTIELLWHGIMAYVAAHRMDVMFGCASLEGTDPDALAGELSVLAQRYAAPPEWAARAVEGRYVRMDRLPAERLAAREALRRLPPLVKGYIRAGCWIGEGAVIDHQFGTTDVLIILPVAGISERYFERFGRAPAKGGEGGAGA